MRLAYIQVPLERDEGAYAYGAWRIMEGDVLYKDMVDFTPPGIFYLYALGISIFGRQIDDLRLFTNVYMGIVLIWMLVLARRLSNDRSAWIAPAILGFISVEPSVLGFTSNKEIFMLLPIIVSAHLCLKGLCEDKSSLFFISGLMTGIGFLIKQVMVFVGIGLLCYMFISSHNQVPLKKLLIRAGLLISGGLTALILCSLYFLKIGAGYNFYYWVFVYPFQFADAPLNKIGMLTHLGNVVRGIARGDGIFWIASIYAVLLLCRKKSLHGWFLICLGLSLTAAVSAGFRFRQHYFILLTPGIALAAGWGISDLIDRAGSIKSNWGRKAILGVLALTIIGLPVSANRNYLFSYTPQAISRKLYGTNPFVESPHIADYIKKSIPEDETIFVFGSEPQIYYYAGIKNPTSQLFMYPLTAGYGKSSAFQREVVSAVKEARPYYIIWIDIQTSLYASTPSADRYVFDEINALLKRAYQLDGYVLIGRDSSAYHFGEDAIAPAYKNEKIPILIYKKKA
ncbi:MAG: glycosyltransferase family 39 protein [bacterium]